MNYTSTYTHLCRSHCLWQACKPEVVTYRKYVPTKEEITVSNYWSFIPLKNKPFCFFWNLIQKHIPNQVYGVRASLLVSDLVSHRSRVKINYVPTASGDNIFYSCPFYSSIRSSPFRKKKKSEMFYGWDVPGSGLAFTKGQWSPTPHCNVPFFCYLQSILKPRKYIKISSFKICRTHFHVSRDSVFGIIFKKRLW